MGDGELGGGGAGRLAPSFFDAPSAFDGAGRKGGCPCGPSGCRAPALQTRGTGSPAPAGAPEAGASHKACRPTIHLKPIPLVLLPGMKPTR